MLALSVWIFLGQTIPAPIEQALVAAAPSGARVEVRSWKPSGARGCAVTAAEVRSLVKASGLIPLRVIGPGCEGWGWAQVALFVPALVLEQPVREGQPVAAIAKEQELTAGRSFLTVLPALAVAARNLPRGTVLEAQHLRSAGPAVGEQITVVATSGSLQIVQRGRVIGCGHTKSCAQLANGRRVEGTLTDGRLIVELQ